MIDLTTKQSELLYEVAELHHEWYKMYYPTDPPALSILLELNHTKICNVAIDDMSEKDITDILIKMKNSFQTLIDDERFGFRYGEID